MGVFIRNVETVNDGELLHLTDMEECQPAVQERQQLQETRQNMQ